MSTLVKSPKKKKEHPILFSTPMVAAILDGSKTQTRRVINPQLSTDVDWIEFGKSVFTPSGHLSGRGLFPPLPEEPNDKVRGEKFIKTPYGNYGDILRIRETWKPIAWSEQGEWVIKYKDGTTMRIEDGLFEDDDDGKKEFDFGCKISDLLTKNKCPYDYNTGLYTEIDKYLPWKPSIFMPKKASRIKLKVKSVDIERLNTISHEDAIAEGVLSRVMPGKSAWYKEDIEYYHYLKDKWGPSPIHSFQTLWQSINGKSPGKTWDDNPWVWVYKFELNDYIHHCTVEDTWS